MGLSLLFILATLFVSACLCEMIHQDPAASGTAGESGEVMPKDITVENNTLCHKGDIKLTGWTIIAQCFLSIAFSDLPAGSLTNILS